MRAAWRSNSAAYTAPALFAAGRRAACSADILFVSYVGDAGFLVFINVEDLLLHGGSFHLVRGQRSVNFLLSGCFRRAAPGNRRQRVRIPCWTTSFPRNRRDRTLHSGGQYSTISLRAFVFMIGERDIGWIVPLHDLKKEITRQEDLVPQPSGRIQKLPAVSRGAKSIGLQ